MWQTNSPFVRRKGRNQSNDDDTHSAMDARHTLRERPGGGAAGRRGRGMWIDVKRSAEISPCGQYRWWLRRHFPHHGDGRVVCFIMLNPSTADATMDDPTIRRCMGFARDWGYSTLSIRNLFAYRATDPKALAQAVDPIGHPRNDGELLAGLTAHTVVVAWGGHVYHNRDQDVLRLFALHRPDKPLYCLGWTKQGSPRHPLYISKQHSLEEYI